VTGLTRSAAVCLDDISHAIEPAAVILERMVVEAEARLKSGAKLIT